MSGLLEELPVSRTLLHVGMPALEVHGFSEGAGCRLLMYVDGAWHTWDLPCTAEEHCVANVLDVTAKYKELTKT